MIVDTPLELKVDYSLLSNMACPLKAALLGYRGFTGKKVSANIAFGSAFHIFSEHFHKTHGNEFAARAASQKLFKTTDKDYNKNSKYLDEVKLFHTCSEYMTALTKVRELREMQPIEYDGDVFVEQRFSIPVYQSQDLLLNLCGTIDQIAKIQGGAYVLSDIKTTSSSSPKNYLDGFALSGQLMLYHYAVNKLAKLYPDSIFGQEICRQSLGTRIIGVFVHPNVEAQFICSNVFFYKEEALCEFENILNRKIVEYATNIINWKKNGQRPLKEGTLTGECFTFNQFCPYFGACNSPDERSFEMMLENFFVSKPYDPLMFRK